MWYVFIAPRVTWTGVLGVFPERILVMSHNAKKLAPVISVLNMKGGVGKTTISAHVFRRLYHKLMKSTLLVDFDPQFNLTQTVVAQADYDAYKDKKRTIMSVMEPELSQSIFKVNTKVAPPPQETDVSVVLRHITSNPEINLSLIPGDFALVKYSLIADQHVLTPIRERFLSFIQQARIKRDLVCIDCNPSSSFMTLCALMASTHVLVPVRPDRYSILGLQMLDEFITNLPLLTNKPKLIVLLNGVKTTGYDPSVENQLRSHKRFGPVTLSNVLKTSKLLEASPGYTGFATDKKHQWRITPQINAVVDELGGKLGLV